ncbi:ATP-binding cassette domain-containing protein [Lachnospiraceae bacterium MD1]|jgi:ABC-2 type transport system ATP-binding protein|uniref:ATP-binding cassette domain-containing protein n=1 Tax=Variimorphobacter saccharofermentans TaxID=2755051 RepID=A0A839K5T4_9FIRM|nr:ATP-binding cassette domain-containing protein [Variimorphobacter saccharofermentans]MBB2184677.1 ATP-binding cassette domain-containing protein [Variimorphobacter saccharofermentans]
MANIITVEHLIKKYETYKKGSGFKENLKSLFFREKVPVMAVNDISFEVKKGDIIGILGPNGAGKSTTIKMLTGTLYPTSGTIDVMGYNPTKNRKSYVHQIGAVFGQKSQLIWDIPPIDSFRMNKAIYGVSNKDYDERINRMAKLFEVEDFITRPTRVLSLGERMKCEFIMAMIHQPKVVFLDEPTIGLDVIAKQNIREFIKEMNQEGTTFILTTHDLEDVEQLARDVIIINHGEKVFDDSIENLRKVLGAKKIVQLTLQRPLKQWDIEGSSLLDKESELNITVSVDLDQISITDFMARLSDKCAFSDISIKEMPMETIITHIYQSKKEE